MYPNPFNFERPYTGQTPYNERCPICGAIGECPDAVVVPMPYPAVDPPGDEYAVQGGPLRLYTVTAYGTTGVMQLNDFDAARYGDAAVLIP